MTRHAVCVPAFSTPATDTNGKPLCDCKKKQTGLSHKEGVVFWQKSPGDTVAQGDVLCELEIEKALYPIPSPAPGVLAQQLIEDGGNFEGEAVLGYVEADASL